jgi:Glyoxalase-like domain
MSIKIQSVSVDALDPIAQGRWWAEALGWQITYQDDDEVVLEPQRGAPEHGVIPDVLFLRVPDTKSVKNRLHLDLRPTNQADEVARFERLGAKRVSVGQTDSVTWVVMADLEGNEFCILRALTAEELAS